MAKCSRCGRAGLFLKIADGVCVNCQHIMREEKEVSRLQAEQAELQKQLGTIRQELSDQGALFERICAEARKTGIEQAHQEMKAEREKAERELQELILKQQAELEAAQQQSEKAQSELAEVQAQITVAKAELVETNEEVLMQSFGLYTPRFSFASATGYKEALAKNRNQQRECIKAERAATGSTSWTVNGDTRKGTKMVRDVQKLLIRAFNCECDDVVDHVKFNNIEAAEKRIRTSCSVISKLGVIFDIAITDTYLTLKIEELYLAYEYQREKQREKDALKALRAEERERAKLEKEIEEARKKIEKERKHYTNAITKINQQIASAAPEERTELEQKKKEMESVLVALDKSKEQIDYRVANQKAGYVYIISNVGAFGEGVYKIGMTRRLEPMDRIDELGDASVPFDFDVHALIFSDDAPALEAALHRAFADRKLNMINTRREFFRVSLDEIKRVVRENYDKTVEFVDIPAAEQFRQSNIIRNQGSTQSV